MGPFEQFEKDVEDEIREHGDRLDLSTALVSTAKSLYSQYHSMDVAYSRPVEEFALSAIYLAHRVFGEPVTVYELTSGSGAREKAVFRVSKRIKRDLVENHGLQLQATTADDYLEKYANRLETSDEVVSYAKTLLEENRELLMNKADSTKAAASLYLASDFCGEYISNQDVSRVSGVTTVSIRNRAKEMRDQMDDA